MESSQSGVGGSSAEQSLLSALVFNTVLNTTTCTLANISWMYYGPSAYLSLSAVHVTVINNTVQPLNDLPSVYLSSANTSSSFWIWDAVNVQGTYALQGSTAALHNLSNAFVVADGVDTSCVISPSPNVSTSGAPVSTLVVTQSPPTSLMSTHSSKSITGPVTGGIIGGVIGIIVIVILSVFLLRFRRRSSSQFQSHPPPRPFSALPLPSLGEPARASSTAADPPHLQSPSLPLYSSRQERLASTGSIVDFNPFDDARAEEPVRNKPLVVGVPRFPLIPPPSLPSSIVSSYASGREYRAETSGTAESDSFHPIIHPLFRLYSVTLPHDSSRREDYHAGLSFAHPDPFRNSVIEGLAQNGAMVLFSPFRRPVSATTVMYQ